MYSVYRRKAVLSDSGGKAPVVSFMFEPKVSYHMYSTQNTILLQHALTHTGVYTSELLLIQHE
jgi:hypothetical protein